LKTRKLLP